MTNKNLRREPLQEKPSDFCKRKQEEALERGDTEEALQYYDLADFWMQKGM